MHQTAACATLILNIATCNSFQIHRSGQNVRVLSRCRRDGRRRSHGHHRRARRLYNDMREHADEYLDGIGVGIDLGTTNSAVAMMLPDHDGKR